MADLPLLARAPGNLNRKLEVRQSQSLEKEHHFIYFELTNYVIFGKRSLYVSFHEALTSKIKKLKGPVTFVLKVIYHTLFLTCFIIVGLCQFFDLRKLDCIFEFV